ncbi:hypothetical protein DFH08DRAFT_816523 [Mycena albidolilacea]|uniref:Uncharacterized protein n=1 Tax=Mycena albidolilacea TaxID=1033008 RepID=A0AAD6ZK60_9AGAR|nr:hypothetical protein DFH08DRAFT_816523 [Mycena albidolilacea]
MDGTKAGHPVDHPLTVQWGSVSHDARRDRMVDRTAVDGGRTVSQQLYLPGHFFELGKLYPLLRSVNITSPNICPSIRPLVDGTAVLPAVRQRDGGLGQGSIKGRDGTVVHLSVRPTVLDGYGDDPYYSLRKRLMCYILIIK